ncbi:hypothetical protein [Mesorhizobium argentiipisi]|uniref:Transposase n=1 Tax=Mesorhizobium argentiipisi TaxID=3015175 RepID=A0ABU8KAY9_9HYPH
MNGTLALERHLNATRAPIKTKESYRWLENLRRPIALGRARSTLPIG